MMRKLRIASACFQLRSSTRNAPVTQVAYHVAIDFILHLHHLHDMRDMRHELPRAQDHVAFHF